MKEYWKTVLPPIKIADGFWHIGSSKGPAYLLTSDDGPILIDTSYAQVMYSLFDNVRSLGFDLSDIKHIVHTHGHIDHVGATRVLKELTGAITYIGVGDEDAVAGRNDLIYAKELGERYDELFEPDVLLRDGDVLDLGGRVIRFVSTPGHTQGTMSLFFDLDWNGGVYRAGMFGGAGFNTLKKSYLEKYRLPLSLRDDYVNSIDKIIGEKVDLHVGNHLANNDTLGKAARMTDTYNPFIAENSYYTFLKDRREKVLEYYKNN